MNDEDFLNQFGVSDLAVCDENNYPSTLGSAFSNMNIVERAFSNMNIVGGAIAPTPNYTSMLGVGATAIVPPNYTSMLGVGGATAIVSNLFGGMMHVSSNFIFPFSPPPTPKCKWCKKIKRLNKLQLQHKKYKLSVMLPQTVAEFKNKVGHFLFNLNYERYDLLENNQLPTSYLHLIPPELMTMIYEVYSSHKLFCGCKNCYAFRHHTTPLVATHVTSCCSFPLNKECFGKASDLICPGCKKKFFIFKVYGKINECQCPSSSFFKTTVTRSSHFSISPNLSNKFDNISNSTTNKEVQKHHQYRNKIEYNRQRKLNKRFKGRFQHQRHFNRR